MYVNFTERFHIKIPKVWHASTLKMSAEFRKNQKIIDNLRLKKPNYQNSILKN